MACIIVYILFIDLPELLISQSQLFHFHAVTMPPELIPGRTSATVSVPEAAANSEVGFLQKMFIVDEGK